jgi:uncharacterized caspase-like protein
MSYTTRIALSILILVSANEILEGQTRGLQLRNKAGEDLASFGNDWAIVIGIDSYRNADLPILHQAVKDAQGVSAMLIDKEGFRRERIVELYNENATRDNVSKAFDELMKKCRPDDRVIVFFAGHGITLPSPVGRERGYILPYDANLLEYATTCVSTDQLAEWSETVPARQLYFIMDACYGGMIFTRSAPLSEEAEGYLKTITSRQSRQAITAGGRDQTVLDIGPQGHSYFTYHLLSAIAEGNGDLNRDGLITASEVAAYVAPRVSADSKLHQTPEYGTLPGSQGGEFVFLAPGTDYQRHSLEDSTRFQKEDRFEFFDEILINKKPTLSLTRGYLRPSLSDGYGLTSIYGVGQSTPAPYTRLQLWIPIEKPAFTTLWPDFVGAAASVEDFRLNLGISPARVLINTIMEVTFSAGIYLKRSEDLRFGLIYGGGLGAVKPQKFRGLIGPGINGNSGSRYADINRTGYFVSLQYGGFAQYFFSRNFGIEAEGLFRFLGQTYIGNITSFSEVGPTENSDPVQIFIYGVKFSAGLVYRF